MFSPVVRLILFLLSLVPLIISFTKGDYSGAAMCTIPSILIIYGYFKYGTVYAANRAIKEEDYKKAEILISKIKNPEYLSKSHKSYYHFTNGLIAFVNEKWENCTTELTIALEIGLRTKNDKSIALLNIANAEYEQKNYVSAKKYLIKCKECVVKELVQIEIDILEKKIESTQHI